MYRFTINNNCFKVLIFSILFLVTLKSNSQSKPSDDLKIMLNYHYGFNLPEYQFISYITDDYIRSFDLCLIKETRGKNYWEQLFNYPEYGISLFYSSLGNDNVFGKETSLNYFFKIKIINKTRFCLYNRTGIGISYTTRKFELENNYLNVAIGSHFNIHFNFRIGTSYVISKKADFNLGLSFDHFSNANSSEPNLGINYVTAYGGLSYRIGKISAKQKHEIQSHVKKNNFECFFNVGGKHTRALTSGYFLTSSISLEANREYFRTFNLGTGIDFFYDSSLKSQLINAEKEFKNVYSFKSGIHLSQIFVYNRFNVIIQEGIYLLLTDKLDNKSIYNKGIIKYWLTKNISLQLSMKSHLQILDYPELGVGFKF
ncbi:MAG: hypothetical protein A2046_09885 [Bacteroidetes bacterium GWA2_30_7]|nr:MAG: hypothetical protein A2046_09885 [Bacteroidetes bacterium GWA2_30_7]